MEGGQGHRHVRPGWYGIDCLYCSPNSQKWKLGINLRTLYTKCWSCGKQYLSEVLTDLLHISPHEAKRLYFQLKGNLEPLPFATKPRGRLQLPPRLGEIQSAHERYLRERGFNPDTLVKLWGLGGIGIDDKLPWRIFIPVHLDGEIVSWTTRSISEKVTERYINASPEQESVPIKHTLLGYDYVGHAIIVCEGPFDVFRIGPGSVCTFGTNVSPEQKRLIAHVPIRVVCFDNEPTAQVQALRLMDELSVWDGETYNVVLDSGKDPATASERDVRKLRQMYLE